MAGKGTGSSGIRQSVLKEELNSAQTIEQSELGFPAFFPATACQ
jgi:hypothetical protein